MSVSENSRISWSGRTKRKSRNPSQEPSPVNSPPKKD